MMQLKCVNRRVRVVKSGKSYVLYLPASDDNKEILEQDFVLVQIGNVVFPANVYRIRSWKNVILNIPSYAKKKLRVQELAGKEIEARIYLVFVSNTAVKSEPHAD